MSPIDEMEKAFFEEYQKVMEKEDSKGRDYNKLVYDEAKKAKYFFEYMRT